MFRRHTMLMYSGVVATWKQGSAYGFVKDTDTGASYFLHKDDIVDGSRNRVNNLPEGFRVEFDKAMFEGRTKAVAVTLRGGAPITSTGELRRDSGRDDRRDSRDRDGDRDDRRRDDRDDRRRSDDRDDRRRSDDRDDRRDDRRSETAHYDRELSRIQGTLRVMSRQATMTYRNQMKLYNSILTIANAKGVVVPPRSDESKAKYEALWAKHREVSEERKEKAIAKKEEKRAEYKARKEAEAAEADVPKASLSKPSSSKPSASQQDAEDMF